MEIQHPVTWKTILADEGLAHTLSLRFEIYEGGIKRVFSNGVEIRFSKKSKLFAKKWISSAYPGCTSINIDFFQGVAHYKDYLCSKRDNREKHKVADLRAWGDPILAR